MRIGLVIPAFDPALGGAEAWTWQFARALLAGGHEVHVVASRFAAHAADAGVVPQPLPPTRGRLAFAAAAEAALRRLPLDVVHDMGAGWHCHVFQPHGGSQVASFEQNLLLLPRALRPAKRALASCLPRYREFQRLNRRQYAADGRLVVALSQMVAGHMRRYHRVPGERIRLVYNGVDVERFAPEHRPRHRRQLRRRLGLRDELLLLIAAHNFRLKGVPTLLRAVGLLNRQAPPRVHLAIAGGKRRARYQRLAERCGAAPAVHFLGPVDDVVPCYAAADVYVQPTWYDPCSLVVLEALASGLPVITTRFNGAGELIGQGREGFVLDDPGDAAALARQIGLFLDPPRREAMGRAARRLALQHTLARNCRQITALYDEVAGRRIAA